MKSLEARGSSCSRVEDPDWVRPDGGVESEAVLKSKTTLEFVKAISRVAKAEAGRTKAACGARELIHEKRQRLSVDQKLP
jgi:hypothetical protein